MFRFRKLALLITSLALLILSGCASFDEHVNTERLLVQVGVMKIIEKGKTPAEQRERAERVVAFSTKVQTWINSEQVGYDQLRSALVDRINEEDLAPSDKILATLVIDSVMTSLRDRVVDGIKLPVPPEQIKYQVNSIFNWAEEFASGYL